jgi:DNA-binding GntR family transcriptional regulator
MLDIRPNDSINESQLSKEIQMGRTPIREALRRLENERLVVTQPRKGSFAAPIEITDLSEIGQVRQILEPTAARMAAQNIRPAQRDGLEQHLAFIDGVESRSVDQNDLIRRDLAVHRAIYSLAGNSHLEHILLQYANLSTRIWAVVLERRPLVIEHITELSGIIRAVLDQDPENAEALMDAHLRSFGQYLASIV